MVERAGSQRAAPVIEAGVHPPGLQRRHVDRVLPVHELIVVQAGTLPIAEDEQRLAVGRDHWVLLRAGHRHYGYDDLDDATWFYWVCFGAGGPLPGNRLAGDAALLHSRRAGPVARPQRLGVLFEQFLDDQHAGLLSSATARSYLQLISAELLHAPPAPASGATAGSHLATRAAAFIADHLTDPDLGTARIAKALACNADYLGRRFREAFDETLTDHIHRRRIDLARMLFRSTHWPVERIAVEIGFSDVRYFRRVFKRRVGLTPGQFQRLRPVGDRGEPVEGKNMLQERYDAPSARRILSSVDASA
ncbi:MAG TPA: helix-turn-helix transcriptional regulator [Actinomycetes bacterium]|jgi:AraC-like DNA-binding protein|nr:helix-turn-helix transcriptional regulator [Actinomycetes bacterium]